MAEQRRTGGLMDGPPARACERVTEDTATTGRRVQVHDQDTDEWVADLRATDPPYYYDRETYLRWLPGQPVPEGANANRASLTVAVCQERDYYAWAWTKRRPRIVEYDATLVWVE